ncbi:MAG: Xaa-Pro peptidase family protein [Thaumarchaeota archaeon]|nr:Xaa-Pro peptidase family protein [Nitrososphaerota archaeon]
MPQIFEQNFGFVDWERLYEINWKKLREGMRGRGIDSLIVGDVANVKYLTGYSPMYSYFMLNTMVAVLPADEPKPVLFPIWYYEEFAKVRFKYLKEVRAIPVDMNKWPEEFEKLGLGKRVGIDSGMTYQLGRLLHEKLKGVEIVVGDDLLAEARSVKNSEELKVIEQATAVAEVGFDKAFEACIPGAKEFDVAAEAEHAMRLAGAEAATHTLVMSEENAASMKETSTDRMIRHQDTVVFDLGAIYEGYNSEFSRTKFVGGASKHQLEVFKLVYEAEQKAIENIRPGASCAEVDSIARKVLREGGWGPPYEYNYNLGHGIGVALWEYPILDERSKATFKENMTLAIEPAVYKHGFGGVRVEDMVQVTSSGAKILSRTPYYYA